MSYSCSEELNCATTCDSFQANSIGVKFEMHLTKPDGTAFPLTGVASAQILFKRGSAATVPEAATVPDPAGNIIHYITTDGDFATPGDWQAQAVLTYSNGNRLRSKLVPFTVLKNL